MDGIEELRLTADVTATGQLVTGSGRLYMATALADGTHAATVILYDNTGASGTVLATLNVSATGIDRWAPFGFSVRFTKGVYASISAGTTHVTAYYK